jgi:hypothetical protein
MSSRSKPNPRLNRVPIFKFFNIIPLLVISVAAAADGLAPAAKPLFILKALPWQRSFSAGIA